MDGLWGSVKIPAQWERVKKGGKRGWGLKREKKTRVKNIGVGVA